MNKSSERADARRNRERLLDAARHLFAERGIDVDVREICERSGVGVATLYRNFSTKEDLIAAITEQVTDEILTGIRRARDEHDPERALVVLLDELLAVVERHHELARVLPKPGAHEHSEHNDHLITETTAIVRAAQRDRVIRTDVSAPILVEIVGGFIGVYVELLRTQRQAAARAAVTRTLWSALRGTSADVPAREASAARD